MPGKPITKPSYGGGSGTESDPYLIYTPEQLNTIGLVPCDLDKHFKLMADFDLAPYTGTDFNIIGTIYDNPFTGVFDGNGHTISNFNFSSISKDGIGLFGYVSGENAEIKDLGLIDPNIDAGTGRYVGSLVGYQSSGTITNCYAEGGSVSGNDYVGGLVGQNNYGNITNCHSAGSVSGDKDVGGLVGENEHGTITNSYSSGSVSGDSRVGGLVGENDWGTITNCYSTGSISGRYDVGGLAGENSYGTITNCYSTGSVTGDHSLGGLVGSNDWGTITNCYSSTSVSGNQFVGGLVGENWYTITNCYATGSVTGTTNVGGLVGDNYWAVTDSFWDTQTSGQTTSAGGTGKTTAEMQRASTFIDAGWDFVDETENGTEDIWCICEGVDYPRLTWQFVIGDFDGDGRVGLTDFAIFAGSWLATDSSFFCGDGGTDLTNDGKVRFNDLREFAENWLQPQPPEPPQLEEGHENQD